MSVRLLMDVHVKRAVTIGLRRRSVDVVTAQKEGFGEFSDSDLLDRATQLNRVLFSQDEDLLVKADTRLANGIRFTGVIYGRQNDLSIGQAVRDLELITKVYEPEDIENRIEYLPL